MKKRNGKIKNFWGDAKRGGKKVKGLRGGVPSKRGQFGNFDQDTDKMNRKLLITLNLKYDALIFSRQLFIMWTDSQEK